MERETCIVSQPGWSQWKSNRAHEQNPPKELNTTIPIDRKTNKMHILTHN
ncbi:sugar transporter, partial [Danaus plexippus plexippus]